MKVAVTGGSGVVGSAVVRHLVAADHDVRALARSKESETVVGSLGADPIFGDVLDPDAVRRLVRDCDWVFHVAGINQMCSLDPGLMRRVNVEGTRVVVEASRRAGVIRLIHTSSAVTIGEERGTVATESSSHRGWYLSEYERSKSEAEHALFTDGLDLDVVAVNPSSVQGPGRATGTGALALAAARGKLPFLIDTTISLVDIDDCARGHLLAAERDEPGQRYLLSGATLTTREAVSLMSRVTGSQLSPRYLRPWAAGAIAAVLEAGYRLGRRHPAICREAVRVMRFGHHYDGSRATRELGLDYTPIEETLRKTVDWFRSEGLL